MSDSSQLTIEPGPSPTIEVLKQILATMREQSALLEALPAAIGDTIRDEMQRELEEEVEWEPAEGAFDTLDEHAGTDDGEPVSRSLVP